MRALRCAAAKAFDARQDVIGRLGPSQRLWIFVLLTDECLDRRDQLFDRGVRASLDLLFGQRREEALDLIDPR
jgi:hypothetical protein